MSIKLSDYNAGPGANNLATGTRKANLYSDLNLVYTNPDQYTPRGLITYDIEAIKNSVKNLVLTNYNERPFHPEIGCGITALLFEPVDFHTAITIRSEIIRVINRFEPRVQDVAVEVFDQSDRNAYYINIGFKISPNNTPATVNFYLNRLR